MAIGGEIRTDTESKKKVGLFAAKVLCINPNIQEYKEILGIDLKEDSKATEYIGESKEGNITVRIQVWLQTLKGDFKVPVTFFMENKQKENKTEEGDGKVKKYQFINKVGSTTWATGRDSVPDWFKKKGEFRIAFVGEDDLYNFARTWLGKIDFSKESAELQMEWKNVLKGNFKLLKEQIDGQFCVPVVAMATVKTVEKEDGPKEYQAVWSKAFMQEYALKHFRLINYDDEVVQDKLKKKEADSKIDRNIKLAAHERFVLNAIGEYGIKDFYKFKDLQDYDSSENIASKQETLENSSVSGDLPF